MCASLLKYAPWGPENIEFMLWIIQEETLTVCRAERWTLALRVLGCVGISVP